MSVDSSGNQANGPSFFFAINGNGQQLAFYTTATNLVSGDTNGTTDVFVRDRDAGTTERVSVDSSGNQSNGQTVGPIISDDGRHVGFWSAASNLVPSDTNSRFDVFVHDRQVSLFKPFSK